VGKKLRLYTAFYSGCYEEVLEIVGRAPLPRAQSPHNADWHLQVGALAFLGDILEAQSVLARAAQSNAVAEDQLLEASFYVGVGLVRKSFYKEAQKHFAQNFIRLKRLPLAGEVRSRGAFFTYQGAAFYRFFFADFKSSQRLALRAYEQAFNADFAFGQALSLELIGHCCCHLGEIRRGLREISRAVGIAKKIGNGGWSLAFAIAHEKFRSQFGANLEKTVQSLERAILSLRPQDTYSRAELYLELSRQLALRGRVSEAKRILEENSETIYQHQNRRQAAIFNLRYSHLLYLQGEASAALALVRSAKSNLVAGVDNWHFSQLEGLEKLIQGARPAPAVRKSLTHMDERILRRYQAATASSSRRIGEDRIADIIDAAVRKGTLALDEVLRSGLWGLVPQLLSCTHGHPFIYFGPTKGSLIAGERGDVHVALQGLSPPMRKVLLHLQARHSATKEDLVREVWGYEYRADRHDPLLHSTVAKLRKVLGPFSRWLKRSEGIYSLEVDATLVGKSPLPSPKAIVEASWPQARILQSVPLNVRQIKALKILESGQSWGVTDYARQFKVSKMTACRDLTQLWRENKLVKSGRARATRYLLASEIRGELEITFQSQNTSRSI
jgi:hypothetical protein